MKKEAVFNRVSRSGVEAGEAGDAASRPDPTIRGIGTDDLQVEETVRRDAGGSGTGAQATAERKRPTQEASD